LADLRSPKGTHSKPKPVHAWWRVMCLTGVDYFSTLGYQPGIAFCAHRFLVAAMIAALLPAAHPSVPVNQGFVAFRIPRG